jgi:tartrate-resistant acid phosphatase type 5
MRYIVVHLYFLCALALVHFCSCHHLHPDATGPTDNSVPFDSQLVVLPNALHFIVIGDWGRKGISGQQVLAEQLGKTAEKVGAQFVISTGDNFYPIGVESTSDQHWFSSFENVYSHPSLNIDWYPVLGNHDYLGNEQAELDYTLISNRWKMPRRYYSIQKELTGHPPVHFLFLDTSPFETAYYSDAAYQNEIAGQDTSAQKDWLMHELTKEATWKIATGHHPLHSGGMRRDLTGSMRQAFESVFREHEVDIYFCGHEHDLQVISPSQEDPLYVVSGAGSELRPTGYLPSSLFAASVQGFVVCSVKANSLLIQVVDAQGKCIYRHYKYR